MPTISDFLFQLVGANIQPVPGTFVRFTNNIGGANFISQAATSSAGLFTIQNVPAGTYIVATGPTGSGPWTNTGDNNYFVGVNVNESDYTSGGNVFVKGSDPWYDVKHPTYGAKGDGTTDDSNAIQNAINAANGAGGGTVYFPPGTYTCSNISFFKNIKYLGAGIQSSILQLRTGAATTVPLLQSNNFASLTGGNTTGGEFNFTFQDLSMDGNKANVASTVPLLRIYGYGYVIQNVRIHHANNEGLYSEWSTSQPPLAPDSMEAHISGLKVHDCGSTGVHWKGPHDSNWTNGEAYFNSARGIWVDTGGAGLLATNVHSYGGQQTYAWYLGDTGCCYRTALPRAQAQHRSE